MMRRPIGALLLVAGLAAAGGIGGCSRGLPSEDRPVVLIPDMEVQRKYRTYGESPFFEDGRMNRMPPVGTVARGTLALDEVYRTGMIIEGTDTTFVAMSPRGRSLDVQQRGRERYNIYCAPCHDQTGGGRGMIVQRGLVPPPALYDARIVAKPDGELYDNITNGIRNMPGYAAQIPVADRWAIVAYVRALQRARNAVVADVPPSRRGELE